LEPALKKTEVSGEANNSSRPRLQMDQTIRLDLGSDLGLDSGPSLGPDLSSDLRPELNAVSDSELELRRKLIQFDGLISYRMMYEMIIRGLPSYEPEYIWSCFAKDMKVTMKDVLNGLQVLLDLGLIQKDGDRLVKGHNALVIDVDYTEYNQKDEFKIMCSKMLAVGGILAGRSMYLNDSANDPKPASEEIPGFSLVDWCLPLAREDYSLFLKEITDVLKKFESKWDPNSTKKFEYFQITTGIIQGTNLNIKK
jgi:hypothetical protein